MLPPAPAAIIDLGCGTGTLTQLLTDEGFTVDSLDFSAEMIKRASVKVPEARFVLGDAADPALDQESYDVVLSRHVLWALPDPAEAFARWIGLPRSGGVVVLVEGNWSTGAGLTANEAERIVRSVRYHAEIRHLPEAIYWGKEISDERYLVLSQS